MILNLKKLLWFKIFKQLKKLFMYFLCIMWRIWLFRWEKSNVLRLFDFYELKVVVMFFLLFIIKGIMGLCYQSWGWDFPNNNYCKSWLELYKNKKNLTAKPMKQKKLIMSFVRECMWQWIYFFILYFCTLGIYCILTYKKMLQKLISFSMTFSIQKYF